MEWQRDRSKAQVVKSESFKVVKNAARDGGRARKVALSIYNNYAKLAETL